MKLFSTGIVLMAVICSSYTMAGKSKSFDARDYYSNICAKDIVKKAKNDGKTYTFEQAKNFCLCRGDVAKKHEAVLSKEDKMTEAEKTAITELIKSCAVQNGIIFK